MKRTAVLAAALLLVATGLPPASAWGRAPAPGGAWAYPRGGRDPLVPPAVLYAGQDLPPLHVTLIGVDAHHPGRPLAVVRLGSDPPVRRVVRPGDRIGDYRILRIRPDGVRVAVPSLAGRAVLDLPLRDSTSSRR